MADADDRGTEPYRLRAGNRLALLMHGAVTSSYGKMGFGLMRYGVAPTVAVVDRDHAGGSLLELTGIACDAPIVAGIREALTFGPDTLVPAVAPPGGILPDDWWDDIREAVAAGLNLVNGLHRPLAADPELTPLLKPGRFIWDVRKEPPGLENGMGRARETPARRILMVGTDMANGKMTAALELDRAARARGIKSRFLATGQIGIVIAGEGVALDAVRIDFATGAVEQLVMRHGWDHDALFIEGQGSLLHPASTGAFALMRGAVPTEMILCHRAGQETIGRAPWVRFPPLREVVTLYETVARAGGCFPESRVAGIALNCGRMTDAEALAEVGRTTAETGLPCTDLLRFSPDPLLDSLGL